MKMVDGFKTYLGIALTMVAGIMNALDANLIADALGLDNQGRAITAIVFVVAGALLAAYGRKDAQRKIDDHVEEKRELGSELRAAKARDNA